MNLEYSHYLKNKVTQSKPAKFADNLTEFIMSMIGIPWKIRFSNDQEYREFSTSTAITVVFIINKYLPEWTEPVQYDPSFWNKNEGAFSKLLYSIRTKFIRESLKTKSLFLLYCVKMLCFSGYYYYQGLSEAPTMAFIEVYRLNCIYNGIEAL